MKKLFSIATESYNESFLYNHNNLLMDWNLFEHRDRSVIPTLEPKLAPSPKQNVNKHVFEIKPEEVDRRRSTHQIQCQHVSTPCNLH